MKYQELRDALEFGGSLNDTFKQRMQLRALLAELDAKTEALEHAIPIVETAYEGHQAACRSIRLRDAYEARYQRFKELLSQGEQT